MVDNRSRYQKLKAMANQTASPEEAEIAREKLKGLTPPPARPFMQFKFSINGVEVKSGEGWVVFTAWSGDPNASQK